MKTKIEQLDEEAKHLPLVGRTIVNTDFYERIKRQAKAYCLNRDEIKQNRADKAEIALFRVDLSSRERHLAEKEVKVDNAYYLQKNLNLAFESLQQDLAREKENNALLRSKQAVLEGDNVKLANTVSELTKSNREAFNALKNVVQTAGMLKYDKTDGYKVKNLTPEQGRLIDSLADYGADCAKKQGHLDIAEKIEKKFGMSKDIEKKIEARTPSTYEHEEFCR